nr:leucine-rich repeat-containing protein 57-like [Ciona intestinalis]|eukprot:XP_026691815.1 leucine-rich repeat-containing protein 57-like [Ciona intestinalis]
MGNAVNTHIQHAEKTGVCQLSSLNIEEFPSALLKLSKSLRTLDLSRNKVKALPDAIGNFSVLKSLNISHNRLPMLCDGICKLLKLESLIASYNMLTALPADISRCKSLKSVVLCGNKLKTVPEQLANLKHLDMLDLSDNQICKIPDTIGNLQAVELNLNQNQVNKIPDALASCQRLKVLRFNNNCVSLGEMSTKLLIESKISLLTYEGNLFTEKDFQQVTGYNKYMERFTATKKKFD